MFAIRIFLIGLFYVFCAETVVVAQKRVDSLLKRTEANPLFNKLYSDAKNAVVKNAIDSLELNSNQVNKSEQAFYKYENKVIRKIEIKQYGYEKNSSDTDNFVGYISNLLKNKLHNNTRTKVIRQNLFIKENTLVEPAKLADNERFLRNLEFIQDARIFIKPCLNDDSVDLIVIVKDLFSLNAVFDAGGLTSMRTRLSDANFLGLGQKIQLSFLLDQTRTPNTGYELLYSKTNIGGSFINGTVAYTQINTGRSEGTEDEFAYYIKLDRPMVTPFSHFAGSLEISNNYSVNVYKKTTDEFLDYKYHVLDGWVGYNLSSSSVGDNVYLKNRKDHLFLSVRYAQIDFLQTPTDVGNNFDPVYNSRKMILLQATAFHQDFYKLKYIYGFGAVEDIPKGYNASIISGWTKQLNLERPYFGFQWQQYWLTNRGAFLNSVFKTGTYLENNKFEDAGILASMNYYSPVNNIGRKKHRELYQLSFTELHNRVTYEPLRLDNVYGLHEFNTDSIQGNTRISFYAESVLYAPEKLLGFHHAWFAGVGFSLMNPEGQPLKNADGYTSFGCGLRLRNDNLVFGTIELHGIYFPRSIDQVGNYVLTLQTDLKYRYKSNFVQAPDIIQLNKGGF